MVAESVGRRSRGWSRVVIFLVACSASAIGASIEEYRVHAWEKILVRSGIGDFAAKMQDYLTQVRDDLAPEPVRVNCPTQTGRTMVAVTLGQSNAANYAEVRTKIADPRVTVFYRGACYEARDPLLGATGRRGSVWPTFARKVLASGRYDHVVLVPAAIGGSTMESWAPGGVHFDRIESRLYRLEDAKLTPTHYLISQGEWEADNGEDGISYQRFTEHLLSNLRKSGAQVFLATTGRCVKKTNPAIRSAQERARIRTGSFEGPDMDRIGLDHRVNGCHLDAAATETVGSAWASAVLSRP